MSFRAIESKITVKLVAIAKHVVVAAVASLSSAYKRSQNKFKALPMNWSFSLWIAWRSQAKVKGKLRGLGIAQKGNLLLW